MPLERVWHIEVLDGVVRCQERWATGFIQRLRHVHHLLQVEVIEPLHLRRSHLCFLDDESDLLGEKLVNELSLVPRQDQIGESLYKLRESQLEGLIK